MPTTVEFWEIDGVSLSEEGWNVTTLAGRYNVPPLRGDNATFAYVEGQEFRRKIPDARTLILNMWTTGVEPYSGAAGDDQMRKWNDNWHFLCQLFWTPRREVTITRRWLRTDGQSGVPSLHVHTAKAQYSGGLEPTMTGRFRSVFNVELRMSDPFFYGQEIVSGPIGRGDTDTVYNPGDYVAASRHLFVDLLGPLSYPELVNATPDPDVRVKYNGNIPDGQTVTLDVRAFTATAAVEEVFIPENPLTKNRVGFIRHSGTRSWMGLERGNNELTLNATSGTGHAIVRFRPPYL
jgi:hypothetical protein